MTIQKSLHQRGEILGSCTDELWNRLAITIAFTQKDSFRAKPLGNKTVVLDEFAMHFNDFGERERLAPCLLNDQCPAFDPVPGWSLSLNCKRSAAVGKKQKAGCTTPDFLTGSAHDLLDLKRECCLGERLQHICFTDYRAEVTVTKKVVCDFVSY